MYRNRMIPAGNDAVSGVEASSPADRLKLPGSTKDNTFSRLTADVNDTDRLKLRDMDPLKPPDMVKNTVLLRPSERILTIDPSEFPPFLFKIGGIEKCSALVPFNAVLSGSEWIIRQNISGFISLDEYLDICGGGMIAFRHFLAALLAVTGSVRRLGNYYLKPENLVLKTSDIFLRSRNRTDVIFADTVWKGETEITAALTPGNGASFNEQLHDLITAAGEDHPQINTGIVLKRLVELQKIGRISMETLQKFLRLWLIELT